MILVVELLEYSRSGKLNLNLQSKDDDCSGAILNWSKLSGSPIASQILDQFKFQIPRTPIALINKFSP
jgi:hypothetical protein